ncbi:thioredoxin family protein, peroxidase [Schizosaccharomyces osmophilus]|uniref:Thioredoxin family protein, peroxidase n=1 Tax=Schizosaccharomyces osmophilus TaxID=2545709 RepID=A0AAE9WA72_9SCHI|nr:thioredoxin family protein, peroxidase [Schizosaccharomyces osmophilus]WBW72208.1 thioredoxin family protein, peroxidase [Schizosaccharomyces osmophilus]
MLFPLKESLEVTLGKLTKGETLFVAYLASVDPRTKQPWCPTVRAALPAFNNIFNSSKTLNLVHVYVGNMPQWRTPDNLYRKNFGISAVPTLGRYYRDAEGNLQNSLLVDYDCLDAQKLSKFIE